jgi:CRP-like cAMP-binding protein
MTLLQRSASGSAPASLESFPLKIGDFSGFLPNLPATCHKKAGEQVATPTDEARNVIYVTAGWAFSYRLLDDGRRQILHIHLPGNLIGLSTITRDVAAWGCEAITEFTYVPLCRDALMAQAWGRPDLALRITAEAVRGEILLRERLADVARRSARERVANFLLELYCRSQSIQVELGAGTRISIPLTQDKIADAVGLTSIHVSRTLRAFKAAGIIRYQGHDLQIVDPGNLKRISTFDDQYILWLQRPNFAEQHSGKIIRS